MRVEIRHTITRYDANDEPTKIELNITGFFYGDDLEDWEIDEKYFPELTEQEEEAIKEALREEKSNSWNESKWRSSREE